MTIPLDELRNLCARAQNRATPTGIPRVAMVQGETGPYLMLAGGQC